MIPGSSNYCFSLGGGVIAINRDGRATLIESSLGDSKIGQC